MEKADGCKIFKRSRKRLRSSKNYNARDTVVPENLPRNPEKRIGDSESEEALPLVATRDEEEFCDDQAALEVPATGEMADLESEMREESVGEVDKTEMVVSHKLTRTVHIGEPKSMTGTLNDLEREFVKNYGKKCLMKGKNIDSNCILKEHKNVFPGYTRDGEILKKCWINWKKDSPAYKEFIKSLKK